MQTRRDCERRQRPIEYITFGLLPEQTALQHAFRQFLYEQRHTVGAVDNLFDDLLGERLSSRDLQDQRGSIGPVETVQGQHTDARLADPGRLELRPERHHQQYRKSA